MDKKPMEQLTIKDAFMFAATMTEDPENCRRCIELALGIEVGSVEVSEEKCLIYNPEYKGVRLDVYANDGNNTHYDVEMQVAKERALEKRSRYYHDQMDMDLLCSGQSYSELPDVHVIFVCDYDPFGEKKYRYTVQKTIREVPGRIYEDGANTTILSTKGENEEEVPKELVNFLKFVALPPEKSEQPFDDPYVTRLQQTIRKIKRSREMGKRYMTLQEYFREDLIEAKEEGISEGIKLGRSEGLELGRSEGIELGRSEGLELGRSEGVEQNLLSLIGKKLAKGKTIEQIADEVEESVERVQELMDKLEQN